MNEFKGTKGLWNEQGHTVYGEELGNRIAVIDYKFKNSIVTKEGIVNAKLIAAAPELLIELQKMVRLFDRELPEFSIGRAACDRSINAINKALGL